MKVIATISAFVLLLIAVQPGTAQQADYNITGAGARAAGFGGAFIGLADDATAIVWNPAGLGQLEKPEASAVVRIISEKAEFVSNIDATYNESSSQSHFQFNFGSFALPIQISDVNLVLAASFQKQIDLYAKEETPSYSYDSKGGANTITPGFALRFGPVFSVGAAANIWTGKTDQTTKYPGSPDDVVTFSFSGTNFAIGTLIDLEGLKSPLPLKFGACFKTPFELSAKYASQNAKLIIQMPSMIGLGLSFRIGDNMAIAADYETRAFGKKKIQIMIADQLYGEEDITESGKDLNQFRVGAEYLIVGRAGVIPLRAGFHTVPTILANRVWNSSLTTYENGTQVVGTGFSAGTGFITDHFAIDAAFSLDVTKKEWTDAGKVDAYQKRTTTNISISGIIYF
jgi:hypothetical protein